MDFTGFPVEVFDFYRDLEYNNTREWWGENRHVYDDLVRPTLDSFISSLPAEWLPLHVYRPHRQVRFSKDKTPYKTAIGAAGGMEGGGVHYVQLSSAGVHTAIGYYAMSWDQLARYRDAVLDEVSGPALRVVVRALLDRGVEVHRFDPLVTAPKGYDRDHERVWYLQARGLTVSDGWPAQHGWTRSRRILSEVLLTWALAMPLIDWLDEHVGPPEL